MGIKKLMRKPSESTSGFTLIELMIVVAIIGILASIAIPNFLRARDKARFTQCVQALTGIKVAMEMFVSDTGDYDIDAIAAGGHNSSALGMYMLPGCLDPTGAAAGCDVKSRIETNCAKGTFAIIVAADKFSYVLNGDARDRHSCKIGVDSGGYCPDNYADCPTAGYSVPPCP